MTLRTDSGSLLIDSGSLANSADCCCDTCCDTFTPSLLSVPSGSLCCSGGSLTLTNDFGCNYSGSVVFSEPVDPCGTDTPCETVVIGPNQTFLFYLSKIEASVIVDATGSGTYSVDVAWSWILYWVENNCGKQTGLGFTANYGPASSCAAATLSFSSVTSSNTGGATLCYPSSVSVS